MGQKLTLKARGLFTQPNQLGETPEGAMSVADNIAISRDGVIEPRPGVGSYANTGLGSVNLLAPYRDSLFIGPADGGTGRPATTPATLTYSYNAEPASTVTAGPFLSPPTGCPTAASEANGLLFFTSSTGVQEIEAVPMGNVYSAGIPEGLEVSASLGTANGTGLTGNSQYAYRIVWGRKDAAGNVQMGAPSGRTVVQSASIPVAVGNSVRTGGTLVTVTTVSAHGLTTGESVVLPVGATGTASFAAGTYVVTVTGASAFTYSEAGTNGTSSIALTYQLSTRDATLYVVRSPGIDSSHFFQIYRSAASGGSDIEPDDSLAQVYEGTVPTSPTTLSRVRVGTTVTVTTTANHGLVTGQTVYIQNVGVFQLIGPSQITVTGLTTFTYVDWTAGPGSDSSALPVVPLTFPVTDTVPDAIAGAALYTNPEQQTISQANDRPALASSLAQFRGSMFYGNITPRASCTWQLLSTDAPNGLQIGDVIGMAGTTMVAAAADSYQMTVTGISFRLYSTAGVGSTARAVQLTAQSIVRAANVLSAYRFLYNGGTYSGVIPTAHYVSTANGTPGSMLFRVAGFGGTPGVISGPYRSGAFAPTRQVTPTSVPAPNRLMWSKDSEPWAVPALNYQDLGSATESVLAKVALRDSLFVFKTDGIWRVTGAGGNWEISPFDPTIVLLAPRAVCALSNSIYALTNQGIVQITDTGVTVVSRPIDDILSALNYSLRGSTALQNLTHMVGYETDRTVRLFFPAAMDLGGVAKSSGLVYNLFTQSWRSFSLPSETLITSACVSPADDALYLGTPGSLILKERRDDRDTSADRYWFMDWKVAAHGSVGQQTSTTLVVNDATGIVVGSVLRLSTGPVAGVVLAMNGTTLTMDRNANLPHLSSLYVFAPITSKWQWSAKVGNPGALHRFREASLLTQFFRSAAWLLGFRSNLAASTDTVAFVDGGPNSSPLNLRTYVPRAQHYGHQIDVSVQVTSGLTAYQINGVSLIYEVVSPRLTR